MKNECWFNPLGRKKCVGITRDSMSFLKIDMSSEYEIPYGNHVGAFGVERRFDVHKGVDLYANQGDPIFAVEPGIVSLIRPFTGLSANSPWWNDTEAVSVAGRSGIVVYGELAINSSLRVGDEVVAGTLMGFVKEVLKNDKGRPTAMLHLALHDHGVQSNGEWKNGKPCPTGLLDPTMKLISLCCDDLKNNKIFVEFSK